MAGLRVGGYMLGIGVIVTGVSALLIALGGGAVVVGVIGITAAVLLFGTGLVVLLTSSLLYAFGD